MRISWLSAGVTVAIIFAMYGFFEKGIKKQ